MPYSGESYVFLKGVACCGKESFVWLWKIISILLWGVINVVGNHSVMAENH